MNSTSRIARLLICGGLFVSATVVAAPAVPLMRASITPSELAVIVAQGDPVSEAIGAYYQSARGIPSANVIRVAFPTGSENISAAQFTTLKAQIDALLPANVQATLLTWTKPFRVQGACGMSITSAFAFGYADKYCNSISNTGVNPYFDSNSTYPWQDHGIRPSMMLGASTLEAAATLINRGIQSEATYPSGDGYLIRTNDVNRSTPRYGDFSRQPALWSFNGGLTLTYIDNSASTTSNYIQGKSQVLFYFTGLTSVPALTTNTYAPGAIGDHLTSFGGILTTTSGQMPSTAWLDAGTTGSYGTVVEPYAVADKFPKASVVIDQYFRGATLIEAYWKSVRQPGQGLFLGEPLARPFPDQPSSTIESGQYVINTRNLRRDSIYRIQALSSADGKWGSVATLQTTTPGQHEYRAPVASDPSAAVRLTGPCGTAAQTVQLTAMSNNYEVAQAGRAQRIYFQVAVSNSAAATSNCDQDVSLAVGNLPAGFVGTVSPSAFSLKPQESGLAIVTVDIDASVPSNGYDLPILVTDKLTGQVRQENYTFGMYLSDSASTDPEQAPLLRIRRPTWYWQLGDYPERNSAYQFPVEADVRPDSGIVKVNYLLQAVDLNDGGDPTPFNASASSSAADFATKLVPDKLAPGTYLLRATGLDASNVEVTVSEIYVFVDAQVNTIRGTSTRDILVGTTGNDVITGFSGADIITGNGGQNVFVYVTMRDALDQITDFKPGVDRVDLSQLLTTIGQSSSTAFAKGYVRLIDSSSGVYIGVDADGSSGIAGVRYLVRLNGVPASAINPLRDLRLQP